MRTGVGVLAVAALLAACGSGQGTTAEAQAQTRAATRPLDIAGVRPGMAVDAAKAVLERAGWVVTTDRGLTWSEAVEEAANRRQGRWSEIRGTGIAVLRATKGEESVALEVHPTADGGRVASVSYRAAHGGRTFEAFRADLHRRYGKPTREPSAGTSGQLTYGNARAGEPILTAALESSGPLLILSEGLIARTAWQASLDRAVNAKIGNVGQSF